MKTYNSREQQEIVKRNGFEEVSSNGDHIKYRRGNKTLILTRVKPNKMVFQRLIKEHKLDV